MRSDIYSWLLVERVWKPGVCEIKISRLMCMLISGTGSNKITLIKEIKNPGLITKTSLKITILASIDQKRGTYFEPKTCQRNLSTCLMVHHIQTYTHQKREHL